MRWHRSWYSVAALVTAACTGGLTSTSVDLSAGVYNLVTVNGEALPFLLNFVDADNRFEVTAGSVTISADGSFLDSATFLLTQAGVASEQTDETVGTWSQSGSRITFTPNDGSGAYTMSLIGDNRLLENGSSLSLAYVR
jgi:hypothetical protein